MNTQDHHEEIRERWARIKGITPDDPKVEKEFSRAQKFMNNLRDSTGKFLGGLREEGTQSRDMAHTFFRLLANRLNLASREEPPTPAEVKEALIQLKDVGRISFFLSFSILPGGGALLIALELLARAHGIEWFTFVPSAFRKLTGQTDDESNDFNSK